MARSVQKVTLTDDQRDELARMICDMAGVEPESARVAATIVAAAALGDTGARRWLETRNGFDAVTAKRMVEAAKAIV